MRKVLTVLSLILIICATNSFAQKKLGFEFDYAKFKLDENSVYLELYYDIKEGDFKTVKLDNGFAIKGNLFIQILDKVKNKAVYSKDFPFEDKFAEITDEVKAKNMLGVLGISIPKGDYLLKVVIDDSNDKTNSKTITENITVNPFDEKTASLSDIQMASRIVKEDVDKNSIFYKSSMEVIPNPAMFYTQLMPVMYYYLELYNLAADNNGKAFKLVKTLFNSTGKQITTSSKPISVKGNAAVEIGNLNLSKYPTDNYTLEIALVDTIGKKAQVSSKRIYLYNPNVKKEEVATKNIEFIGSEYSLLPEVECDKMLDQIKYIAADDELAQMKKIDSYDGKKQFLYNFWVSRNSNSSKGSNESRVEFDNRVQYANKNFSYKYKEGYKTDRGRVIIKYGVPDDIERHPNEQNTQPYEKWTYNSVEQEPNVIFVFGDISGFGNYILLHSTKINEAFDDNWIKKIQKY